LKRSELRAWLLKKYGSASALARALDVTRQTAHNLLTGRTVPSYENCEKLGLSAAFLVRETEGKREMTNLDDFLMQREQNRRTGGIMSEMELNTVLLTERGASMIKDLIKATRATAMRVGTIDGVPLEWDDGQAGRSLSPLLKLRPVGAQFKGPMFSATFGTKGLWVAFGWLPSGSGIGTKALDRVWNLTLSCDDGVLAWDVNRDEIIAASSTELAERIVKHLIEFRDEYQTRAERDGLLES